MKRLPLITLVAAALSTLSTPPAGAQGPPSTARAAAIVGHISGAAGVVYRARTSNGTPLDALKIIQGPRPGSYLGVFHEAEPGGPRRADRSSRDR